MTILISYQLGTDYLLMPLILKGLKSCMLEMIVFISLQFEKTADHLFEAAYHGQKDVISG